MRKVPVAFFGWDHFGVYECKEIRQKKVVEVVFSKPRSAEAVQSVGFFEVNRPVLTDLEHSGATGLYGEQ